MRALSTSELLDLWERGAGLCPLDQGLLALSAVLPDAAAERLADWPLGRRNRSLLELYCVCFGQRLEGWSACAHCGEKMEFDIDSRALMSQVMEGRGEATVTVRDRSFRLPTSRDLAAAAQAGEISGAAIRVLERCQVSGENSAAWPPTEVQEIEEKMALADPLAETRLALRCPDCGHEAEETLDIAGFVWNQIAGRTRRLLWEIHSLATAYGWTEAQILSLSPARRARYLGMVQA